MNFKIIIAIILLIVIGAAFYVPLQKDTEVLIVDVTLARPPDDDSAKIISNVSASLSYVRKMEVPEDTPMAMPAVIVLVIQNKQEKSGWYSVPLPTSGSIYGKYRLTIKLSDKIDRSQPVRILARVVDPIGKDVSVRAVDIYIILEQ